MNCNLQDKKIYFEAKAFDGIFQSRTLPFKDNPNYFGILVEPSLDTYNTCIQNRKNILFTGRLATYRYIDM